ncbi:MAG TPA: hypothetical protein VFU02_05365 [Polyangiaceae bacterium]|nr:hypothetical protein [Polyangiaceae bacterium]
MRRRVIPMCMVALSVGCGGATELNDNGAGNDGGGTGGSGTGGTSNGTTSGGGTTSFTTATTATNATVTGTSTTGVHCADVECGGLPCPDGEWQTLPGECCPVCVCPAVSCEPVSCPNGRIETPPGYCCPQCVEELCSDVLCDGPSECGEGRTFTRPAGACCAGCMPDEPGSVACVEIACPPDDNCAKGYVPGDRMGGCCYECLPDPLYCEQNADCVIADRPRTCCGCPEVISKRALEDDACWSPVSDPRPIPEECYPDVICDAVCGACAEPGVAVCVDNRCIEDILLE